MFFHIVFVSSYSSQLGFLISFLNHLNRISTIKKKQIIFIIQLPTKGDPQTKYSLHNFSILKNYLQNFDLYSLKINNHFKRFILWFFLLTFYPLLFFNKFIFLWQPRPNWVNGIFSYKIFSLPLALPKKNIIYFGDGFLSLCKTDSPFWLLKKSKKFPKTKKLISNKNIFYYLFNVNNKKLSVNDIKIDRKFINKIIDDIIKIKFNELNSFNTTTLALKKKELFIFPTSTFHETSRSTLNNEIKMYLEYIISKTNTSKNIICIKPHPGSNSRKTFIIEDKLKSKGYELFNWESLFNIKDNNFIPLSVLPLEVFITLLINKLNVDYNNIRLVLSSNASLSSLILHPKLTTLNAFSDILIKKYLNKNFVNNRLEQERLIKVYSKEIFCK